MTMSDSLMGSLPSASPCIFSLPLCVYYCSVSPAYRTMLSSDYLFFVFFFYWKIILFHFTLLCIVWDRARVCANARFDTTRRHDGGEYTAKGLLQLPLPVDILSLTHIHTPFTCSVPQFANNVPVFVSLHRCVRHIFERRINQGDRVRMCLYNNFCSECARAFAAETLSALLVRCKICQKQSREMETRWCVLCSANYSRKSFVTNSVLVNVIVVVTNIFNLSSLVLMASSYFMSSNRIWPGSCALCIGRKSHFVSIQFSTQKTIAWCWNTHLAPAALKWCVVIFSNSLCEARTTQSCKVNYALF